jgi:hypothetical protein
MNRKQIKDGIETIKDCLESNDHEITGALAMLVHYLEANVDDILDVGEDDEFSDDFEEGDND